MSKNKQDGPRILFLDIETSPILANVWSIWEQNVGLNQIQRDWFILSWAAKWEHEDKMMYQDQRKARNIEDDSKLLKGIWNLLDECDIVVTQNGKAFDIKKLNARFVLNGMKPPSSFKHIDTKQIASQNFGFTSNKLEYLSNKLNKKYKKLNHGKFGGMVLWTECLKGNLQAWKEMEKYNKYDVLSLQELYNTLLPWAKNTPNFNVYHNEYHHICPCGSKDLKRYGFAFTATGKFQRFVCKACGRESRDSKNMLEKEKRDSLKRNVTG